MRSGAALLGLVIVLGIGYYMYRPSLEPSPGEKVSPVQQVDVTGVKADLLSIAQAERLYLIGHSTYGTLEELQQDGSLNFSGARTSRVQVYRRGRWCQPLQNHRSALPIPPRQSGLLCLSTRP